MARPKSANASSFPFSDPSWIYQDAIKAGASASLAASRMIDPGKIMKTTGLVDTGLFAEMHRDILRNSGIGATIKQLTEPSTRASSVFTNLADSNRLYEPYRQGLVDTARFASIAGVMQTNFFANEVMRSSVLRMTEHLHQNIGVQSFASELIAQQWARSAALVTPALLGQSGTTADGLAALWTPIVRQPKVLDALSDLAISIRTPGPLGPDYGSISRSADRLSVELDELPREDREEIERAVDAAAEATTTAAPGVHDQVAVLGLEGFARRHHIDIAVILAFTVGLTYVVFQAGAGVLEPGTFYEAATYGAGTFEYVRRKLRP